jgi:hypothetical protein
VVAGDTFYVGTDNARPRYPTFRDEAGVLMAFRAEAIWGLPSTGGNWLYVGNVEGRMTVLRAGRQKELLAQVEMDAPLLFVSSTDRRRILSGHGEPLVPHHGKALRVVRVLHAGGLEGMPDEPAGYCELSDGFLLLFSERLPLLDRTLGVGCRRSISGERTVRSGRDAGQGAEA